MLLRLRSSSFLSCIYQELPKTYHRLGRVCRTRGGNRSRFVWWIAIFQRQDQISQMSQFIDGWDTYSDIESEQNGQAWTPSRIVAPSRSRRVCVRVNAWAWLWIEMLFGFRLSLAPWRTWASGSLAASFSVQIELWGLVGHADMIYGGSFLYQSLLGHDRNLFGRCRVRCRKPPTASASV